MLSPEVALFILLMAMLQIAMNIDEKIKKKKHKKS